MASLAWSLVDGLKEAKHVILSLVASSCHLPLSFHLEIFRKTLRLKHNRFIPRLPNVPCVLELSSYIKPLPKSIPAPGRGVLVVGAHFAG